MEVLAVVTERRRDETRRPHLPCSPARTFHVSYLGHHPRRRVLGRCDARKIDLPMQLKLTRRCREWKEVITVMFAALMVSLPWLSRAMKPWVLTNVCLRHVVEKC